MYSSNLPKLVIYMSFYDEIAEFIIFCYFFHAHNMYAISIVVQSLSRVWVFATPWTAVRQVSLPFTIFGVCSNSCPLSQWVHPTSSSSVIPSTPPSIRVFPMCPFFTSGCRSIGLSASAPALTTNIQGWFPLGLARLISLLSKGLSKVFSNTTVQKASIFSTQLSLWPNSHTHIWLLEKP